MMEEGEDRIRATYGKNYDRLAKIKKQLRPGEPVPRKSEHQAHVKEGPPASDSRLVGYA